MRYLLLSVVALVTLPYVLQAASEDVPIYPDWEPKEVSLKQIAPEGVTISSILRANHDVRSVGLLPHHVDVLVSENGLKAASYFPAGEDHCQSGSVQADWSDWQRALKTAKKNNWSVAWHAHALYWPKHTWPSCIMNDRPVRRRFIEDFALQVRGAVSVDVLNEVLRKTRENDPGDTEFKPYAAFSPSDLENLETRADTLRQLIEPSIADQSGQDALDFLASVVVDLREAMGCEQACPIVFLINDVQISWGGTSADTKRAAILALIQELAERGAKIDGIGMQAHLTPIPDLRPNKSKLKEFLGRAEQLGLEVQISELDLEWSSSQTPDDFSDRDHATIIREFLSAMLSSPVVTRLGFWGLADVDSYLYLSCQDTVEKRLERFGRKKPCNENEGPTFYEYDSSVKEPIFTAVREELQKAAAER
jgi:GH35 family endo-1,4-beta-xylanase